MDGQEQTQAVSAEVVDSQAQEASGPVDIAQAFQMLRESDKKAAEPPMEEEAGNEQAVSSDGLSGEPDTGAVLPAIEQPESEVSIGNGEYSPIGGSATDEPSNDYRVVSQGIIRQIQEQARQEVLKEFQDHNIKILTIKDIWEQSEDGTVKFNNPDDPRHPFANRVEAQKWVDSINAGIQYEYQNMIAKRSGELWEEAQPQIQLLQFAPYYERMDKMSQDVFDKLIEPYSIMKNGQVVGFNCNLAKMAQQAVDIVNTMGRRAPAQTKTQQPGAAAAKPATAPAMDMKTGTGETNDSDEPKDINEAMAMLNKQRREKRNG